jgi:amino acid adenylation domain-containing protein
MTVHPSPPAEGESGWTVAASFAQERLWLLQRLEPDSAAYNLIVNLRLHGPPNVRALRLTLDEIVARHEPLRTTFSARDGAVMQTIHPCGSAELPVTDLSHLPWEQAEAEARRLTAAAALRPFDLATAPLWRPHLLRLAVDDHVLSLIAHHIIFDQRSAVVLRRELSALHDAFRDGRPSPLPPLPIQYADYAAWQRSWLTGDTLQRQLDYWRTQLADLPPLDLPTDRPRPLIRRPAGATIAFTIPTEVTRQLRALARDRGASLFMTLLASLQALLARYTGQHDIAVGIPIAGRTHPDTEPLIGFFVNTLVVRTDLSGDPTIGELLRRVRDTTLDAYAHQDLPFEHLVYDLRSGRDRSRNPLFDVMFNFRTEDGTTGRPGLTDLDACGFGATTAKFDLTVDLVEAGDTLHGGIEYSIELLDRATVERLADQFQQVLSRVAAAPEQHLSELPVPQETTPDRAPDRRRLVAYVVPADADQPPTTEELRTFLSDRLPASLVPAVFVTLDALPLTPSGKIDRRALPAPNVTRPGQQPPRTLTEQLLASIWLEVLQVDQVGAHDNFFELGGHSLLAVQVVVRIRAQLQVDLPLATIFDFPTLAQLATQLDGSARVEPLPPLALADRDRPLPLSFAQQRLWFLHQLDPTSPEYNTPITLHLTGRLDPRALQRALTEIVRRHEVLRTTITAAANGVPSQTIQATNAVDLPVTDLSDLPAEQALQEARRLVDADMARLFDLATQPPMRAQLIRLRHDEHVLGLTLYHIASDRWSEDVLRQELATLYAAFLDGRPSPLPPLPIQYADYAAWQRTWLTSQTLERLLGYWRIQLAGLVPLELPSDRPRPSVRSPAGGVHEFTISAETTQALRALARQAGVSTFMVLLAGLQALLARYTGRHDVAVGTPIVNRSHPDTEALIGFFLNTLVLRTDLSGDPTVTELLNRVRTVALDAYTHRDLPFEHLVDALQLDRDMSRHPLVQVIFDYESTARGMQQRQLADLQLSEFRVSCVTVRNDLHLFITEAEQTLQGAMEYSTQLFDEATIKRLTGHFQLLLEAIASNPQRHLSELPLLTPTERVQLTEWSSGPTTVPSGEECVHQLLTSQAHTTPASAAVTAEAGRLTYTELEAGANRLAHHLQSLGAGPETTVAVCLNRGLDLVVTLLAIWKAGAVYLPLDPDAPMTRSRFHLTDAAASLVVTTRDLIDQLPDHPTPLLLLDEPATQQGVAAMPHTPPASRLHPDNAAYVIYTSGSTGTPKGVILAHRGLANLAHAQRQLFGVTASDRVLQFASATFDASLSEIAMTLTAGAELVIATPSQRDTPDALARHMTDHQVSVATLPPTVLALLTPNSTSSLQTIISAGEQLPAPVAARWSTPKIRLVNAYGPTETTVCATAATCDPEDHQPPIGHPLANTSCHVLDAHLVPVPVGVPGELYVGGVGLARGYVNQPALTAAWFIANPFAPDGSRLYRSGDLVRRRPDGQLEFLGRIDQQVKVRGYRVEPGEIEATLMSHPGVGGAVVALQNDVDQEKRLIAYVTLACPDQPFTHDELRAHLTARLPGYLIPSRFMTLETLPITSSGKVDRHNLPTPDSARPDLPATYEPPRTPVERALVDIWQDILHLDQIGAYDNFFDLGGHSLLATQVIARIRTQLQVDLPVATLFDSPVLTNWAALVEDALIKEIEQLSDDSVRQLLGDGEPP